MFVAFFALILRSTMQNKLRAYMAETDLTFSSVLKELRKMKYVRTRDGKRLLSPITKKAEGHPECLWSLYRRFACLA